MFNFTTCSFLAFLLLSHFVTGAPVTKPQEDTTGMPAERIYGNSLSRFVQQVPKGVSSANYHGFVLNPPPQAGAQAQAQGHQNDNNPNSPAVGVPPSQPAENLGELQSRSGAHENPEGGQNSRPSTPESTTRTPKTPSNKSSPGSAQGEPKGASVSPGKPTPEQPNPEQAALVTSPGSPSSAHAANEHVKSPGSPSSAHAANEQVKSSKVNPQLLYEQHHDFHCNPPSGYPMIEHPEDPAYWLVQKSCGSSVSHK